MKIKKKLGDLKLIDILLLKTSIVAATLFLLNLLPGVVAWMEVQHWGWFLGAALLFAIIPISKLCKKNFKNSKK